MHLHPTRSDFDALAQQGNTTPVFELIADCETPPSAYRKSGKDGPAFLFESIVGIRISRYSFLGANPRKVYRVSDDTTTITLRDGTVETVPTPDDPLKLISEMAAYTRPLAGHATLQWWAVGSSVTFIHSVEPQCSQTHESALDLLTLYYVITDSVLIFDHVRQVSHLRSRAHRRRRIGRRYAAAKDEIERIYRIYSNQPPADSPPAQPDHPRTGGQLP